MPRGRTTRAATKKRPIPSMSEDDTKTNLDEDQRTHKLQTLILDFKTEISSRIQNLKHNMTGLLSQIDLAYTMEIMEIPPEVRVMKLNDFLKSGGAFEKPAVTNLLEKEIEAIIGSHLEPVEEEDDSQVQTVKKTRHRGKTNTVLATAEQTQTMRRTGRNQKVADQTPANYKKMLSMATPLITPKFDPRLYQTPAVVMRAPKAGEVIVSIDGSPLTNTGQASQSGVLVSIDNSKSVWLAQDADLSTMDRNAMALACRTMDEIRSRLQDAMKLKPTV